MIFIFNFKKKLISPLIKFKISVCLETANILIKSFNISHSRFRTNQELINVLKIKTINLNKQLRMYHLVEQFRCKLINPKKNKIIGLDQKETISTGRIFLNCLFKRNSRLLLTFKEKKLMMRLIDEHLDEPI